MVLTKVHSVGDKKGFYLIHRCNYKITVMKRAERRQPEGGETWWKGSTATHLPGSDDICCKGEDAVKKKEGSSLYPRLLCSMGRLSRGDHYPGDASAESLSPVSARYKNHSVNCLPGVGVPGKGSASSWESQRKPWVVVGSGTPGGSLCSHRRP